MERFDNAELAGFRSSGPEALHSLLTKPTPTLMVVKAGNIAYSYGDMGHVSNNLSVRKSILSILYRRYVANGLVDLNRTVGDLKIN